ncbi:uncharacterized protein METZ01_LOCUS369757, partial [marine metagenome]
LRKSADIAEYHNVLTKFLRRNNLTIEQRNVSVFVKIN